MYGLILHTNPQRTIMRNRFKINQPKTIKIINHPIIHMEEAMDWCDRQHELKTIKKYQLDQGEINPFQIDLASQENEAKNLIEISQKH